MCACVCICVPLRETHTKKNWNWSSQLIIGWVRMSIQFHICQIPKHNNHFWNDYYVLSSLQRVHSHTRAHIHTHRLFLFNILLFLSSFSRCGNRHPKWFTCSRINKSIWQSQDSNLSPPDHQSCALPYLWSPRDPCWCLITKSTGWRISERGWGNAGRSLSRIGLGGKVGGAVDELLAS